jgi:hypothetical protein
MKNHKKNYKTVEIEFFLTFFCLIMEESGSRSEQKMTDLDPGGPKHTDPTEPDPDPQHWFQFQ